MSTPPPPPAAGPHDGERRKSLGKYVKRMSSVFKREKSTKTLPQADRQPSQLDVPREDAAQQLGVGKEIAKPESIRQEVPTAAPATANQLTPTTSLNAPPVQPTSPRDDNATPSPAPIQFASPLDRNAMQQERARALFAKYGLTLESHDFMTTSAPAPAPLVPRVEKAIRMRVHRSCHHCGALYGHDKVCVQCEHKRCKKCPRYPKKRAPGENKDKEKDAVGQPKKKKLLTLTTRSGNELAYQPATQRVRRTCHKCDALFVPPTATACASCQHARCTKCPREPAKRAKWPAGYPGDAEAESDDEADVQKQLEHFRRIWRKPRRIVRWECEQCHTMFRQGSPHCPGCGHERCDQCTRSPVKKQRQDETFDPAVVAAVEAKLRALGVDDDPPTSEPEHV
ncbi:hypothetical protein N0V95_009992 [Ascochyta clinopodiicola]|nr:hypothetical protein N0V95_009992 [Ascochyta clinopodiicola]